MMGPSGRYAAATRPVRLSLPVLAVLVAAAAAAVALWWQDPFWIWLGTAIALATIAAVPIRADYGTRALRRGPDLRELARLAAEADLQRSVFEVSAELVGCIDAEDALARFTSALRSYWRFEACECWVWERGVWSPLTGDVDPGAEPPPLSAPVHLPDAFDQRLVLDCSPAVRGQALLVAHGAAPQPTLADHSREDQLAVAEVLRGQLALALRRVILYRELQDLARIDPLTATARRWYGEQRLREALAAGSTAVALVDIDHFKRINDAHGHRAGDTALAAVGRELSRQLRPGDVVSRFGGEEFVVILPGLDALMAGNVVERLAAGVRSLQLPTGAITVSAGVVVMPVGASPSDALDHADRACYAAKNGGRDRVVVA